MHTTDEMKKDQKDIVATKEDESFDIGDIDIDKKIADKGETKEVDIESLAEETITDDETFEDKTYENTSDLEYFGPVEEYPSPQEEAKDEEKISDIEYELEGDPEEQKEHFYQKHIKKNYKLLHPYEEK